AKRSTRPGSRWARESECASHELPRSGFQALDATRMPRRAARIALQPHHGNVPVRARNAVVPAGLSGRLTMLSEPGGSETEVAPRTGTQQWRLIRGESGPGGSEPGVRAGPDRPAAWRPRTP